VKLPNPFRRKTPLVKAVDALQEHDQWMQDMLVRAVEQRLREMSPEEALKAIKILKGEQ